MESDAGLRRWRCHVVASILRLGAAVVVPLLAYYAYRLAVGGTLWLLPAHVAVLALYVGAALWPRNACVAKGASLLLAIYWLGWLSLNGGGYESEAQALLLAAVVFATLFYGRVAGFVALVLNASLLLAIGGLQAIHMVGAEHTGLESSDAWLQVWGGKALMVIVVGGALVYAVAHLVGRLEAALGESTRQVRHLEARDVLLTRETEELTQRNAQLVGQSDALRAAVRLVVDTEPTRQEDALLEGAAALIGEHCGFEHVGVFLLDPSGEWAELRASSSDGGRRMLSRRHRLRVGAEGIVGLVTATGAPYVAPHVADDPTYYRNPDLPQTMSEIAVPMRDQGTVIGALDIQQSSPGAFDRGDICAVQALGDIVAALHRNGRLFRQLEQSLAAERRAYAQLSAQAWIQRTRLTEEIAYRYEQGRIHRLSVAGTERGESGRRVRPQHTWPLSIRGRFAGLVEARKTPGQGEWTDSEREFMETVIEQLGPALESARLYEDTQSRAARDRLLADVMARARETLDLDTVLRTAADEMYIALDLGEVMIHLVPPSRGRVALGEED